MDSKHKKRNIPSVSQKGNRRDGQNRFVVTPKTTIAELLAIPGMYEKLMKLGVPCVVCPIVGFEQAFLTIEGVAKAYGLDLNKILQELNDNSTKLDEHNRHDR